MELLTVYLTFTLPWLIWLEMMGYDTSGTRLGPGESP